MLSFFQTLTLTPFNSALDGFLKVLCRWVQVTDGILVTSRNEGGPHGAPAVVEWWEGGGGVRRGISIQT
jgi:hypothetical protein